MSSILIMENDEKFKESINFLYPLMRHSNEILPTEKKSIQATPTPFIAYDG